MYYMYVVSYDLVTSLVTKFNSSLLLSQKTEQEILSNTYGSSRYQQFVKGLGQLIHLKECPSNLVYLGGLDTTGIDGTLACFWEDDITQGMHVHFFFCVHLYLHYFFKHYYFCPTMLREVQCCHRKS